MLASCATRVSRRAVRSARPRAARGAPRDAWVVRPPLLRPVDRDAPAAVDHARERRRRLARVLVQAQGSRPRDAWAPANRARSSAFSPRSATASGSIRRGRGLLALGGGVGIPPMIFLAEQVRDDRNLRPLVFMGSEVPFPFDLVESRLRSARRRQGGHACRRTARAMGRAVATRQQRRPRRRAARLHHRPRPRRAASDERRASERQPRCSRADRRRC